MGQAIVKAARFIYNKIDKALDYISYKLCPDRPTYRLATANLHIPNEDLSCVERIVNIVGKTLGLIVVPFQMLNNKKFTIHIYETTTTFTTPNGPQVVNSVYTCDKMLIYIAQNRNKIIESIDNQILKTATINNHDYDIPINFWYSFNIDETHKVYFFVHISLITNYRGVVISVDKKKSENLTLIKNKAIDFYDQTIGQQNQQYTTDARIDFI